MNGPQLLASVLPLRNPIIPKTVQLGYDFDVQDLGQAIAAVPQDVVDPQEDAEVLDEPTTSPYGRMSYGGIVKVIFQFMKVIFRFMKVILVQQTLIF